MAARPRIKASFRPLRRGTDAMQLGLSAESGALILSGLTPAEMTLLERVDGSLSEAQLYASAVADGVDRQRVEGLLQLLREYGVLTATTLDRVEVARLDWLRAGDHPLRLLERRGRHVVIDGVGSLPWAVANLLRSGGTGRVDVGTWAADLLDADLRRGDGRTPDVVVLVAPAALDAGAGDPWRRRGIPHLPVVTDGDRVVVGPLVGRDAGLPCLRCVHLTRAERDAGWPSLAAQAAFAVHTGADAATGGRDPQMDAALLALASGVVAMCVNALLDGEQLPAGVSVEASLPWPRLDHRRWVRHPACEGHGTGSPDVRGQAPGGSTGGLVASRVTMTR